MGYLSDKKVLVLVANAARARIFSPAPETGVLMEIETLVSPGARLHGAGLQNDREGRSYDSVGGGRHAMESPTRGKDHIADKFARDVSDRLVELAAGNGSVNIALVAAPEFLGRLRKVIAANISAMITSEISKDLTASDASEIESVVTGDMRG